MDDIYSIPEGCRRLGGISKYTLQAWFSSGKAQRTKVGNRTMIRQSEIDRLACDQPPTRRKPKS